MLVLLGVACLTSNPLQNEDQSPTVIDTGPGTEYIEPRLWGLMYRHAARQDGVPEELEIDLRGHRHVTLEVSLDQQIEEAGGAYIGDAIFRVPTGAVAAVIQRPDVWWAALSPRPPDTSVPASILSRLEESLAMVVLAHSNGVPAEQAALAVMIANEGRVGVVIDAPDAAKQAQVQAWLSHQGIYMPPPRGTASQTLHTIAAMMPVDQISPLMREFATIRVDAFGYADQGLTISRMWWPQETRDLERNLVATFAGDAATPPP